MQSKKVLQEYRKPAGLERVRTITEPNKKRRSEESKLNDSYSNTSNTLSKRKRLLNLWLENPYITAKKASKLFGLDYRKSGNYLNKLLSEFRSNPPIGSALESHTFHRRVFVCENVLRSFLPENLQECFHEWKGWIQSSNRNGMLVFQGKTGKLHWYKGGLVRIYLDNARPIARAKELFCETFGWLDNEVLLKLSASLMLNGQHRVIPVGATVPRFDVRTYEKNVGIRIYADNSHPRAVEVEESVPFWVPGLLKNIEVLKDIIDQIKKCSPKREKNID